MKNTRPPSARQGFIQVGRGEFTDLDQYSYRIMVNLKGHAPGFAPSYRLIAAQTNMSAKTVQRRLEYLESEGLITRAGTGRNRTIIWEVNNTPVWTRRPNRSGPGGVTKNTNGGLRDSCSPKAKFPPSLAGWNRSGPQPATIHPISRLGPNDISFAKQVEKYFYEPGKKDARFRLNYDEFNRAIRDMRDRYGYDAHVTLACWMFEHYPGGLPFHRKNWNILMARIWPEQQRAAGG